MWTGKGEGKEKSAGVAEGVKSTDGGITYVEWSYAQDNDLGIAKIDNGGGAGRADRRDRRQGASPAADAGRHGQRPARSSSTTRPRRPGAYPIVLVTYEIVCSQGRRTPTKAARRSRRFLEHFASDETQTGLEEIGYAPLPDGGPAPRSRPPSTPIS